MTLPTSISLNQLGSHSVRSRTGEPLGSVADLMIDLPTGAVSYAVISVGGVLGVGARRVAVPWSVMGLDHEKDELVVPVTGRALQGLPDWDRDNPVCLERDAFDRACKPSSEDGPSFEFGSISR